MFYRYPDSLDNLISRLARLPGIGPKSAGRLAFHLLHAREQEALALADAILKARRLIHHCPLCANLTDEKVCLICSDSGREQSLLCVVEQPRDLVSMERTRSFNGLYHVLHGAISPIDGIGPEKLTVDLLLNRLKNGRFQEVIMATNPNVEGEATAQYLARLIKPLRIKVSRIAHGVPVGGDLEYADEATLAQALSGRKAL